MKKLLISGISVFGVGLIAIFIGWLSGGFNPNSFNLNHINETPLQSAQTKSLHQFKTIDVNTNAEVTVKSGNEFKVVTQTPKGVKIDTNVDNGQLQINQTGKSSHEKHISFLDLHISGDEEVNNGKVTVYVPSDQRLSQITQTDKNHSLNLDQITVSKPLTLHGELYLNHVTAPSAKLTAESGDIAVDNSRFMNGISSIESDSGDVDIEKSSFDQLSNVESQSGDCNIVNNTVNTGMTKLSSDSGDVEASHNRFDRLEISSDSGDVDFSALTIKHSITATSDSGDVSGKLLANDRAHIKGSSDSGDIDIKRSLNHPSATKQYHFSTDSGDVEIE
ncbi:DUF4097 family beta strand repeat-containing protein [Lactobacillaceae bacterium Melli_B3]